MDSIVLASGNKGKIAEFNQLFADLGVTVVAQTQLGVHSVPETGTTFVENAIIKARHAAQVTGLPALADDSGLVVEALNGAPGIISARYAGEDATDADNVALLLEQLGDANNRNAYFTCVLVFMLHADDPSPMIAQGRWHGQIAQAAKGEHGFGYDPVFYCPQLGKHAAECDKAEKATVSHRALALKDLLPAFQAMMTRD